jgi:hypothetical protein
VVARATTGSPAAIASMTALGAWSMPLGKAKIAVPRSTCDSPPSPGRISPITAVITTVGLQDAHQVIPVRRRERVPPGDEGDDGREEADLEALQRRAERRQQNCGQQRDGEQPHGRDRPVRHRRGPAGGARSVGPGGGEAGQQRQPAQRLLPAAGDGRYGEQQQPIERDQGNDQEQQPLGTPPQPNARERHGGRGGNGCDKGEHFETLAVFGLGPRLPG